MPNGYPGSGPTMPYRLDDMDAELLRHLIKSLSGLAKPLDSRAKP
jgi:hypothetical protein